MVFDGFVINATWLKDISMHCKRCKLISYDQLSLTSKSGKKLGSSLIPESKMHA